MASPLQPRPEQGTDPNTPAGGAAGAAGRGSEPTLHPAHLGLGLSISGTLTLTQPTSLIKEPPTAGLFLKRTEHSLHQALSQGGWREAGEHLKRF